MPLWLDLLRTPMAAPESRSLRIMRYSWQALCLACAATVGFFPRLHTAIGRAAPIGVSILVTATLVMTVLYLARKHKADSAYLDALGAGE